MVSEKDQVITLRAREKGAILAAKGLIEFECDQAEPKIPFTHFVNIPVLSHPEVLQRYDSFLDSKQALDMNQHFWQKGNKLHFTILMLKLHTMEQVQKAKVVIEVLDEDEEYKKRNRYVVC